MSLSQLQDSLAPLRQKLVTHPLYASLKTLEDLQIFMQHHVFAVWDFMSLLKRLQRDLTSVDLAWTPKGGRQTRRFINEIVMGEESDDDGQGGYTSHFELYRQAMTECGVSIVSSSRLLSALAHGESVTSALLTAEAPLPARHFVQTTFELIEHALIHSVAAAFTLGREEIVPDMFRELVRQLHSRFPEQLKTFLFYLERHIELDEGHHTPMAMQMMNEVCGENEVRWREASQAAHKAMQARIDFWTGIQTALSQKR